MNELENKVISIMSKRFTGYIKLLQKSGLSASDFDCAIKSLLKIGVIEHRHSKSHATYSDADLYKLCSRRTQDAPDLKRASAKSEIESSPAVSGG